MNINKIYNREIKETKCSCKKYRQYVSIIRPRSYEPRALPLRHAGWYHPSVSIQRLPFNDKEITIESSDT